MFKRLWGILCGYYVLSVPKELRGQVYQILFSMGIEFFGERNSKKGKLTLCIPRKHKASLQGELESCGLCDITLSDLRGIPVFLRFLVRRPGILCGCIIFLLWSYIGGRIVWDIRIEGNTVTPDIEIIELLSELGCGYGDWIPSIDYDEVSAQYIARSDTISWISVFMNGTVAKVQVRELIRGEKTEHESGTYANVVADKDGIIEIVRVFEGQAAVKPGDFVRAGDLVISGVVEKKDMNLPEGGVRYEYAAGEVMARSVCTVEVKIPQRREEKIYTGAETVSKRVKIFNFYVNLSENIKKLFKNTGIEYAKYDKIDKIEKVSLFGICELPVWIETTVCREYAYEMTEVSAERVAADAFAELRRLTDDAIGDGELLSRSFSSSFEDGSYTITCQLTVRRNIAKTIEFSADASQ